MLTVVGSEAVTGVIVAGLLVRSLCICFPPSGILDLERAQGNGSDGRRLECV